MASGLPYDPYDRISEPEFLKDVFFKRV